MRPRKYMNRITVKKYIETPDGFAGAEAADGPTETTSWCNVRTLSADRILEYGLDQNRTTIEIGLRKRNDIDYQDNDIYFVYKGKEFTPNSVVETDLNGYEYRIIATENG